MDKTLKYTQVMSNFDSAYNVPPSCPSSSTKYIPLSSSTIFSTFSDRPSSPLFQRCVSPLPRRPIISPESVPKFNFDLYKMNENTDKYDDYISSTYRPLSPTSSDIIYHYPVRSSLSSPTSQSPTLSRLRQINEELSRTLARSEFTDPLSSLTTTTSAAPHYHIHHYPLSQYSPRRHRSPSTSDERSSSIEVPLPSNIHKARVVYKIHVPRRPRQDLPTQKSSHYKPRSDENTSNEQIVVDLYPTREQAFVTQRRKHSEDQSPWIVNGKSLHYDSHSDTSASQTPRGLYYGDKQIQSSRHKGRPSSSSQCKPSSDRAQIRTSDPKQKRRIANAESKVKSAWEPTVTGLHQPTESESKPGTPVRKPKDKSISKNESHVSTPPKRQEKSRSPSPIVETPRESSRTPPKPTVPEPDQGTKSTIKNDVVVHGDDAKSNHDQNPTPPRPTQTNQDNDNRSKSRASNPPSTPSKSPTNDQKSSPPKVKTEKEDEDEEDDDENDQEVAASFDIGRWLNDASKAILNPSEKNQIVVPSTPPQLPPARPKPKSPPRRKQQPPSPPPDENLYKPPFGPKRTEQKSPNPPPTTTSTDGTHEVDNFFS